MKTKISHSGVCLLLAALGLAAAQVTACSSEFRSCYDTRTCPPAKEDAGAAGEESANSGGANEAAGGRGMDVSGAGHAGVDRVPAEPGAGAGGTSGEAGATAVDMGGEGGAAGASCGEACACEGHPCDCKIGEQQSCSAKGLLGSCAAGTRSCGSDRHWGACSIQPKTKDTCAPSNDDNCNGIVNEGCPCVQGQQRPCSDGGLVGKCAAGKQTCGADATWGACSIVPAASDTCQLGNNDNCSGAANEGCLCIEGVTTRPCGVCQDGTQTCTSGATGQFGECVGATTMKTYYLDADGDGHAVNISTTICGSPPEHYITGPVDDCYDSNPDVFPGQTDWFKTHRGDGSFDYNCSNIEETFFKKGDEVGCASCDGSSSCGCATKYKLPSSPGCGLDFGQNTCFAAPVCGLHGIPTVQECH